MQLLRREKLIGPPNSRILALAQCARGSAQELENSFKGGRCLALCPIPNQTENPPEAWVLSDGGQPGLGFCQAISHVVERSLVHIQESVIAKEGLTARGNNRPEEFRAPTEVSKNGLGSDFDSFQGLSADHNHCIPNEVRELLFKVIEVRAPRSILGNKVGQIRINAEI